MAAFIPLRVGEQVSYDTGELGGGKIWSINKVTQMAFCEFSPKGIYWTGNISLGRLCRL